MADDVKATKLTATGTVKAGRCRLKGFYILAGATAGSVAFNNGATDGTTLLEIDTPASATTPIFMELPDNGMVFDDGCYAAITNAASVTAFWA